MARILPIARGGATRIKRRVGVADPDDMALPLPAPEVPSRYRVHRLADPRPTERGVLYRRGERRYLLAWERVKRALAAEVGEPEGLRRVVFDLAVQVEGSECVACRLEVDPGDAARIWARAIELGVGRSGCCPSLRATAAEGWPSRSHCDLETFDEAALEAIRFR